MYSVDKKDIVIEINNIPQSSVGAPCTIVVSDESTVLVAYYMQENDDSKFNFEPIVIVKFSGCLSQMFGPPNDEAFNGHPLASRGLHPYSFFVIKNSSWLRILEKMNSVHPYHNKKLYEGYNHYILSFHDSVFECISKNYNYEIIDDSMQNAFDLMKNKLHNI